MGGGAISVKYGGSASVASCSFFRNSAEMVLLPSTATAPLNASPCPQRQLLTTHGVRLPPPPRAPVEPSSFTAWMTRTVEFS